MTSSYIIGPTGHQYNDLEHKDIEFIKDKKELPPPDKLSEKLKKLMIFDDFDAKEQNIKEHFCRGRHNNCNMTSLMILNLVIQILAKYVIRYRESLIITLSLI